MKLIEFDEQTIAIAKDQPEYLPLPAHQTNDESGTIIFCWKGGIKDRIAFLFTGKLWHQVMTFNNPLQPQLLQSYKPEMRKSNDN